MMMIAKTKDAPDSLTHSLTQAGVGRSVGAFHWLLAFGMMRNGRLRDGRTDGRTDRVPDHESTMLKDRVALRDEEMSDVITLYKPFQG